MELTFDVSVTIDDIRDINTLRLLIYNALDGDVHSQTLKKSHSEMKKSQASNGNKFRYSATEVACVRPRRGDKKNGRLQYLCRNSNAKKEAQETHKKKLTVTDQPSDRPSGL